MNEFSGKQITVMGLGLFGGGAGVTRYLVERGASVTVTDLRTPKDLKKGLALIEGLEVRRVIGEHREEDFENADLVIVNPAVPPESPYLEIARRNGIPVETEINLMFQRLETERVIGITGSNGKTTTSHLVHHMIQASGERSYLGGNLGGSLLEKLSGMETRDVVVLELSSFQLERMNGLGPAVAVITNITPNHLDRHGTFEAYVEAKARIVQRANALVINADDEVSCERFREAGVPLVMFSSRRSLEEGYCLENGWIVERWKGEEKALLDTARVTLPGRFNAENLMAAMAGVRLVVDALPEAALSTGADFTGVKHRLEVVAEKRGITFINDSIATTPISCEAALSALSGDITLIAGGYDKGIPLDGMAEAVCRFARRVIVLGETGEKLRQSIVSAAKREGLAGPELSRAANLEEAVKEAAESAGSGATVLLSPGFASYDQFLNFEERGDCFRRCVAVL